MIDNKIKFDEGWNKEDNETTLYFIAPKEMLSDDYPEAVSAEIMIEFPTDNAKAEYACASISPTRYVEEYDGYEDYDWCDIMMSDKYINELIELARKAGWSEEQEVE